MEGEKRSTILVVDDEEININLLEGYLMHDYDIIPARTGSEALKIIKQKVPDLVLLDVMMPDMNGYMYATNSKIHLKPNSFQL